MVLNPVCSFDRVTREFSPKEITQIERGVSDILFWQFDDMRSALLPLLLERSTEEVG